MVQGESAAAVTSNPKCPRCAYALRGAVATWTDSCPIQGTCTECGLEFLWRDALVLSWSNVPWCVEHGPPRELPRRVLRTCLLTFLPWRFWSQLQMHHEMRPMRLLLYLLSLGALGYVLICLCAGAWAWCYAAGYGGQLQAQVEPASAALRAIVLPFSGEPLGTYTVVGRNGVWNMSSSRDISSRPVQRSLGTLLPSTLVLALSTVAFAALPISRRRAKVRWAHILRVAAYGLGMLAMFWFLMMAALAIRHLEVFGTFNSIGPVFRLVDQVLGLILQLTIVGSLPACMVWWSLATSRYLKMRHAWGVGLAVVVIGALTSILLLAVATGFK